MQRQALTGELPIYELMDNLILMLTYMILEYRNRDYVIAYGLGNGPHVLEVTVSGNKRSESTGVFLVIDAFFVSDQPQAMIEPSTQIESDNSFVIQSGNWSSEGGINLISNAMGSKLIIEFMGDAVKMNAVAGPNRGIANIRIDGQFYPDIDLFDTEYRNKDYIIAYGLGSGPHVLEVTVSGNKRAEATAAYLVIDAFLTSEQAQTIIEPEIRVESDNSKVIQSGNWSNEGGINVVSNAAGSKLVLKFTGDAVKMNAAVGPNRGIANIRIDGKHYFDLDLYDREYRNLVYTIAYGLGEGPHTLEVTVSGNKRSESTDSFLAIAIFFIKGEAQSLIEPDTRTESDNRSVLPSGNWFSEGGINIASNETGSKLVVKFTGDAIKMNVVTGPNRGIAHVQIDGNSYSDIDLYDIEFRNKEYTIAYGLGNGPHTLEITVSGNKRLESSNTYLVVHAFFSFEPSNRIESDNGFVIQSGNWFSEGGINLSSNSMGSKLVVKFTGDAVKMNAVAGPNRGIAGIRIDGQPYPDIDLYDTEFRNRDYRIAYGLDHGSHVLEVNVSGNKRAESTDTYLVVDTFLVFGEVKPLQEPGNRIESDNALVIQSGYWFSEGGVNLASDSTGSKLVLKFTGDAVKMNAVAGPNRGIANIRIDGRPYPDIDLYEPEYRNREYIMAYGLGQGPHLLEVTVSGNKRAEATSNYVVVDAFSAIGQAQTILEPSNRIESDNSLVVKDGTWYSEGEVNLASNTTGSKLVLKFTGDAVKMSAVVGPNRGIANVRIDGQPYPDIDLYDSSYARRDYTLAYGLGDGMHTIVVSVSGNRRLESNDNFVVIDAFFVSGN
ncbi:hypothetical protein [Paenibacillus elgii]|uniref:hypothetical protein n=1 Tax=Paenibacillus elgii TaxID=189691 RepID=UPI000FDB7305|nr:hypothetical protein [Paenibacillus elgii]NEN87040.1 hypothetical protein [Paenibacillus elgii]